MVIVDVHDTTEDATGSTKTITLTQLETALNALATANWIGTFGDGSDGAVTLDGTTTFNSFSSLAGSTYTLTRDVFATSLTVNNTVILQPAGYRIFCTGAFSNAGTVSYPGANASGATRGAGIAQGSFANGGPGVTGVTGVGAAPSSNAGSVAVGAGGAGGSGTSGAGGAAVSPNITSTFPFRLPHAVLAGVTQGKFNSGATAPAGAFGGSSGAGDGTTAGGGGGSGGGVIAILAHSAVNTGTITVAGGNGGTPSGGNCGGGGGGGGGLIVAYTLTAWSAGTTTVTGGTGGGHTGTGVSGSAGGTGNVLNVVLA